MDNPTDDMEDSDSSDVLKQVEKLITASANEQDIEDGREVWGYMWTSWYSPPTWKLWAWAAASFLSRSMCGVHDLTKPYGFSSIG